MITGEIDFRVLFNSYGIVGGWFIASILALTFVALFGGTSNKSKYSSLV